jgi:hypothetical protein
VVGTAVLPRDGAHAALLLRAADRALAAARSSAVRDSAVRDSAVPPSGGTEFAAGTESTSEPMSESESEVAEVAAEDCGPGPDQDTRRPGNHSPSATATSQPVYRLLAQGCDLSVT